MIGRFTKKCLGRMVSGRSDLGLGRQGRRRLLRSGHRMVLAAMVPAALGVAALWPAAASADLTNGFHVFDLSGHPIKLLQANGSFDGTPPLASVLEPGAGYQDFEGVWYFGDPHQYSAVYGILDDQGQQIGKFTANFYIGAFRELAVSCSTDVGVCSPQDVTNDRTDVALYDNPGTVHEVPAGQGQQQAQVLKQLCDESNSATCKFAATSEMNILSPAHVVGKPLINDTDEEQETTVTAEDTVGSTDSVEVGLKVGGKIAGLVEVEVDAKYGHEWTQEHKFSQDVRVFCPAHHTCWIEAIEPMFRDTGDFTLTLGNTIWHLHDVYFDSPNPDGTGAFAVKECEVGADGCPSEGKTLTATAKPKVVSGTYTPPRKLDASAIVKSTLHLAIAGPSTVTAGQPASYRISLSRMQSEDRFMYALTDVRVVGKAAGRPARRWRLGSLAVNRSRTFKLKVAVPGSAKGSFCVAVSAAAKHARAAEARDCVPVAG
jgi:hypothetical protein